MPSRRKVNERFSNVLLEDFRMRGKGWLVCVGRVCSGNMVCANMHPFRGAVETGKGVKPSLPDTGAPYTVLLSTGLSMLAVTTQTTLD